MTDQLHPSVSETDHARGDADSAIVITVFGDYECPVSGRLWRVLHALRETNPSLREVFRHFPLTGVHPHALAAAQAAEAADDQGRFWLMHDRMFEHQDALDVAELAAHAAKLGLDVERFDEDLAYGAFADAVRAHQRSGISSGVSTTPALFLNGDRLLLEAPEELPSRLTDVKQ